MKRGNPSDRRAIKQKGNVDQTDSLFALESLDDGVSKEERQQRFATQLAENKYLEMQKERPILEAKYIAAKKMADPTVTYTLENAITFIAECQDMCPEFEREDREFSNTLDPFEMLPRDNKLDAPRVDHQKAVKRYKRSGAGDPPPLPSDVRPPLVLKRTLKYLFYDLISTYGLEETNAFIWDRTRAIRNDCILQNNRGVEAIEIHEPIARYHIMCTNALCGTTGYEIRLEVEQLEKTLQSLTEFYKEVRRQNIQSPNEAEFQAYNLLVSPWDPEMGAKLERDLPESLFFDPLIQLAFKIRFSMSRKGDDKIPSEDGAINQFAKIFRLLKSPNTSYLMACCVHLHFKDIRRAAIRAMQRSYWYRDDEPTSGHRLPEIVSLLGFDDESEAINFLQHYKIDVINLNEMSDDQSDTYAYIGRKVGKSGKGDPPIYPFKELIDDPPLQQSILVEMKKPDVSYGDLLLQSHNNIGSRNHSDSFSNMPPKAIPPTSVSSNRTTLKGISSTTSSLSNGELKPSLSVQNGFQSLHNNITPQKTNPTFVKKELTLPVTNQHQTLNTFSNPIPSTILSTAGTPNKTNFSFTAAANSFPISNPNTSRVVESVTSTFIPSPNSFIPISNQTMHKPHKSSPLRPVESTFTQPLPPVFQPPLPTFNPQPALNFTPKLKENTYLPVVSNAPVMPQFQLKQKSPSNIKQSFEKPQIVTQPVQFAAPNHSSLRITTPIKSPLYPQFQNEWANKFLHGLIEDLILQLVVTEHHHIVSNYNDVLVTECIESLIDDIIEETATETLDKSKMLHAFGTSLVFSGNKLISDVVEEMVKLTIFEECENYHLGRYEKYGWDRWRYCILRKNYREQKKMLMQRNMLTCLRQTSAIIPRFAMPKSALPNTINNGLLQAKLFDISKQLAQERIHWYDHLDFNSDLIPFIPPMKTNRVKLVVAVCENGNKTPGDIPWFTNRWLISKFKTLVDQPETQNGTTLLSKVGFDGESANNFKLVIQAFNVSTAQLPERPHNSRSCLSGLNVAVFQFEYFNGHFNELFNYWRKQFDLFHSFLSNIPLSSSIPLLLVFWPSSSITRSTAEFQISKIVSGSDCLCHIEIVFLDVLLEKFDSNLAESQLVPKLQSILRNIDQEPVLDTGLLDLTSDYFNQYMRITENIGKLIPLNFSLVPIVHEVTLNAMIEVYNTLLEELVSIISSSSLVNIPYPAEEFSTFSIDWNCPESFQFLQNTLQESMLPPIKLSGSVYSNTSAVITVYLTYIEQLSSLCSIDLVALESLKKHLVGLIDEPTISVADIFLGITNLTLTSFSDFIQLNQRPFKSSEIDKMKFYKKSQMIYSNFKNSQPFMKIESTMPSSKKKRKAEELVRIVDSPAMKEVKEAYRIALLSAQNAAKVNQETIEKLLQS